MTFVRLKWASFAHSTVYLCLLVSWAAGWDSGKQVFGWAHGLGWFAMCGLAIVGLRRAIIPLYVAVCVAVIGAVGPFVGSAAFIHAERAKKRGIVQG